MAGGIDEYINLKAARAVTKIECHGKHASTALTFGQQRFLAIILRNFQVVAIATAITDSADCSRVEMLEKFLAPGKFLPS